VLLLRKVYDVKCFASDILLLLRTVCKLHSVIIVSFAQSMQFLGHLQILQIFLWYAVVYAVFSRIRYCRDLRVFCVNFVTSRRWSRKSFDKYHVCTKALFAVVDIQFPSTHLSRSCAI